MKGSYPEKVIVHSNVKDGQIVFQKLLVNEEKQKAWIHAVSKEKVNFEKPRHFKVCLNHCLKESSKKSSYVVNGIFLSSKSIKNKIAIQLG